MAPSHGIGSRFNCKAQNETYFMSNIAPQIPLLNQRAWGGLEKLVSDVYAKDFNEVWVITGPIFNKTWVFQTCSGVEIPVAFYKIIVRVLSGQPDILAIKFSQDTKPKVKLKTLVTTVDNIKKLTGLDFFTDLSDEIEKFAEKKRATADTWKLDTKLDTNFRPQSKFRHNCI